MLADLIVINIKIIMCRALLVDITKYKFSKRVNLT